MNSKHQAALRMAMHPHHPATAYATDCNSQTSCAAFYTTIGMPVPDDVRECVCEKAPDDVVRTTDDIVEGDHMRENDEMNEDRHG